MVAVALIVLGLCHQISSAEIGKLPKENIVTVCNSTYCDELEAVNWCPDAPDLHVYVTSEAGDRFKHSVTNFENEDGTSGADFIITVNRSQELQKVVGFGGALTDASAQMISCLSEKTKQNLLNSYFNCETGIGYYLLRTSLGGCDFSPEKYTYDDTTEPDPELESFSLNKMDTEYKIPLIKEAQAISCRKIRLKGTTWYWPDWMMSEQSKNKTWLPHQDSPYDIQKAIQNGVNEEYEQTWAMYHVRALTEYKNLGIDFDYLTPGNEIVVGKFSYHWGKDRYQNWVTKHFCPTIKESGYESLNLLAFDDQTVFLSDWEKILDNPDVRSCFKGFATHWYADLFPGATVSIQKEFCRKYPEQILLPTESSICEYEPNYNQTTDWKKAVRYARDIITKMSNCAHGYIDWNIALDFQGGPNWVKNYCYAAVAVDCNADEFHKRILFYVLGHFSKFLPEGSVRLEATVMKNDQADAALQPLEVLAFKVESQECSSPNIVTIALNRNEQDVNSAICFENGKCAKITVPKSSIISTVSLIPSEY